MACACGKYEPSRNRNHRLSRVFSSRFRYTRCYVRFVGRTLCYDKDTHEIKVVFLYGVSRGIAKILFRGGRGFLKN